MKPYQSEALVKIYPSSNLSSKKKNADNTLKIIQTIKLASLIKLPDLNDETTKSAPIEMKQI